MRLGGIEMKQDAQTEAVNVYEDEIKTSFLVRKETKDTLTFPDNLLKLKLELQACDDQKCLAKETVNLMICL